MNFTLAIEANTAQLARETALKLGNSTNQLSREDSEHAAYVKLCQQAAGRLNGWQFDREEANAR
jgi:hypothetical protein